MSLARKKILQPLSLEGVKTYPLSSRKSLVTAQDFGRPVLPRSSFEKFLNSLPGILAARDFREVVARIGKAHARGRPVILGMGAHPIKVGLSPLIIHLMEKGVLQGVAMNGAGIIHDFEVAFAGMTSEDVAFEIGEGSFGMAEETGRILNAAINQSGEKGWGLGRSVGEAIWKSNFRHRGLSITAAGARLGIPVTVHVAVGTDVIHMHPHCRGAALGEGSHRDFRLFAALVSRLEGGVYLNLGSAVILPEVFLKALSLARNQGYRVGNFTSVNMDFIPHYRPLTNVVQRPTLGGGKGFHLTGHHEIMFPLLTAAILEEIRAGERGKRRRGEKG
ncbi:MAG: hypothetical protein AMJ94_02345 [Deltaproteobacteria bacterium SM23_61]|nr:MAG: hypothetical protein AMJ94_02345 [Deltaproteobacteria bacterium SM23_61]